MLAEIAFTLVLLPAKASLQNLPAQLPQLCQAAPAQTTSVELDWGREVTLADLRRLPSDHDFKQYYLNWLKTRYAYNIAKLNEAYSLDSTSFTDLAESDFRTLNQKLPAVVADDALFTLDFASYLASQVKEGCPASVTKLAWKRKRT